jgi:hypothetical protein
MGCTVSVMPGNYVGQLPVTSSSLHIFARGLPLTSERFAGGGRGGGKILKEIILGHNEKPMDPILIQI